MRFFRLLPLALVGICFAAPAPADGNTTGAVQSLEAGIAVHSIADNTVTTLDAPFKAPSLLPRNETSVRTTPENLHRTSISISEYCDAGVLKARGWLSNGRVMFELHLNAEQVTKISLHPGHDQIVGPYDFASHAFGIEHDGCKWSSEGGYPCGWCKAQPWTLGPLNCQTGQRGNQRLTYRTCYFVDHNPPTLSARGQEPTISPPPPAPSLPSENLVTIQGSTVTLHPLIIQTTLPATPPNQISTILPFHLFLYESCSPNTSPIAGAVYKNGNMALSLSLTPGLKTSIQHLVPGYANLEVGPFEYGASRVGFRIPVRSIWNSRFTNATLNIQPVTELLGYLKPIRLAHNISH
ncbi:hypothetical protein ST47_g2292 [Ascochyta rabiei]|uniref:Uncharacterized protein n=1 Tax=Didymella rabiei TaxID=5454 RepID=A0A163JV64_DIDRA|nr:hypothetical protein ST47_g2292 [Ascochyta rabiei]